MESGDNEGASAIHIWRRPGSSAKARGFKIVVDGDVLGTVRESSDSTVSLAPGVHDVRLRIDWCSSKSLRIDLSEGDKRELECRIHSASFWPCVFAPSRYIDLVPRGELGKTPGLSMPARLGIGVAALLVFATSASVAGLSLAVMSSVLVLLFLAIWLLP